MDAKSALKLKSKLLPGLRDNERVLIQTVISPAIYWKGIAILVIALIFLLIAYQLAIFLALVGVLTLVFAHIRKLYLLLVVTNQRVLVKAGVILTDMIQLQYSKIESVETQTTLMGQFLGYSTLMVGGTGRSLAFIPFVANAAPIQNVINEILQQRDASSEEYLERQAHVQAEALAEVLEDHEKKI